VFDRPDRERPGAAARKASAGGAPASLPPGLSVVRRAGNRAVVAYLQRQSHSAGAQAHGAVGHPQAGLAADEAAVARILTIGARSPQSAGLVAHGRKAGVSGRSILDAMTSQGGPAAQQVLAGIAFCVLRGAGSAVADFIAAGRITIRVGDPAVLTGGIAAVYVATPSTLNGVALQADTMYLKGDLSAESITDQATVVHEAEHALQDSRPRDQLTHAEAEVRAYVAQASYTWTELESLPAAERPGAIAQVGSSLSSELVIALSIGAAATPARRAMYTAILSASHFPVPNQAQMDNLMQAREDRKLAQLAHLIGGDYQAAMGQDTSDAAPFDGIRAGRH
jgi:hypothetical protein